MNKSSIYSGASVAQVREDVKHLVDFKNNGLSIGELHTLLQEKLAPHLMRYDLPGFQSLFNAFPEEGAKLGAQIALDYNQGVTNWIVSPGGAMLEELCLRAVCSLFGFGSEADATFMYCGTYANQEALYLALHRFAEQQGFDYSTNGLKGFRGDKPLAVAASSDAHFSIRHAVRMLGLGEESIITLPVDKNRRIDVSGMKSVLDKNKIEKNVFCMVATTGTTSCGSVDPISPLADYCRDNDIWLHVDGAYGLAYSLVPEWKHLFNGIARADSVAWDPHKQMGVPIPNSILFVRRWQDFGRMAVHSSYFNRSEDVEPNPGLKSPPSTRPFSALPLVTSLLHQGLDRVIERLRAPLCAIRDFYDFCMTQKDIEVCNRPDTGILCFRIIPQGYEGGAVDELQQTVHTKITAGGKRSISLTKLDGRTVLRVLAVSPAVTFGALKETLALIREIAAGKQEQQ